MTTNKDRAVEVMRNFWHDGRYAVGFDEIADALADAGLLTPDPQPRTLKDMTPEERQQMIGRWCEDATGNLVVYVRDSRPVEGENEWGDSAVVIGGGHDPANDLSRPWLGSLIPRPDLPRMVWPDEQATEEGTPLDQIGRMSMEAHQAKVMADSIEDYKGGRFVDVDLGEDTPEPDQPRPEDVPEGEVWIVECYGDRHVGTRDPNEAPNWALARMDGLDATLAGDELVALVTRLVPEVKA